MLAVDAPSGSNLANYSDQVEKHTSPQAELCHSLLRIAEAAQSISDHSPSGQFNAGTINALAVHATRVVAMRLCQVLDSDQSLPVEELKRIVKISYDFEEVQQSCLKGNANTPLLDEQERKLITIRLGHRSLKLKDARGLKAVASLRQQLLTFDTGGPDVLERQATQLEISDPTLTDEALEKLLEDWPDIQSLMLCGCELVTGNSLPESILSRLRTLDMSHSGLDAKGLDRIHASARELATLTIVNCDKVTGGNSLEELEKRCVVTGPEHSRCNLPARLCALNDSLKDLPAQISLTNTFCQISELAHEIQSYTFNAGYYRPDWQQLREYNTQLQQEMLSLTEHDKLQSLVKQLSEAIEGKNQRNTSSIAKKVAHSSEELARGQVPLFKKWLDKQKTDHSGALYLQYTFEITGVEGLTDVLLTGLLNFVQMGCPQLEGFTLRHCTRVTGTAFKALTKHKIQELELLEASGLTVKGIQTLASLSIGTIRLGPVRPTISEAIQQLPAETKSKFEFQCSEKAKLIDKNDKLRNLQSTSAVFGGKKEL